MSSFPNNARTSEDFEMKQSRLFHVVLFVAMALFVQGLLLTGLTAQAGRGGLSGLVSDSTGAVIPGAKVVLLNSGTGVEQTTYTTGAGLYTFVSLNPGTYQVTATQTAFESVVQKHITISVDQLTVINIKLRVGAVSEVVNVTQGVDLIEPSNSTVGQLISAEAIDRVPMLTRNVFDLVQLSPGVTPANAAPNSSSSFAIENISSGRPGVDVSSYTINGAIVGSVYYMVDGSPIGVAENNAAAIIPAMDLPEDGVDEIRVETQNTPASYLSGGAGVISLVTKSGTNKFHGDVFGVFRPDFLAANEYFNKQSQIGSGTSNTPPSFHRYQEGAAIGGPIVRKKLFFFADYEATQQQQFDGSNYFTVPTTAERAGDFSADPFTIYDPTQADISSGPLAGTRQPFAGNKITNLNATTSKFLSEMPKCNVSNIPGVPCDTASDDITYNYFAPGLDPTTAQRADVRIDWNVGDKQRIFARFSMDRLFNSTFNAFGNMWDLNYAQNVTNGKNILIADDYTFNASTFLQLRYSFTRHFENQGGDPRQDGFDITTLGFPASLAAAEIKKGLPFILFNDADSGSGSGVGGTADYNTFQYASENSDANVSLTKLIGKHEFTLGYEYMKRFLNVGQPPAGSGAYAFDISATDQTVGSAIGGSDFASALLGMGTQPGTESNSYPNFTQDLFAAESNPYNAAFIEDTYHVNKKITLTLGLRWDVFGGKTERHNRLEYFDPNVANTANGVNYTGAEIYASSGNRTPFKTNLLDLGPRIGFSWQPIERLVIRGGAGFYYGPSPQMVGSASLDSDGYSTQNLWNATAYNQDLNTIAYDCNNFQVCGDSGNTVLLSPIQNPFPNGLVPLLSNPTGLANNLGNSLNTMLHSQRTPTTYNFNFGWEYEFPEQVILTVGYVGSRGLFLPFNNADINQLDLGTIEANGSNLLNTYVPNLWAAIQPPTNANSGQATVPLFVALQKYPQFGNGSYGAGNGVNVHGFPGGDSDYSSLQVKVQKRMVKHFTTMAGFTWSKLMTDDGNPPLGFVGAHLGAAQDIKNLSLEHSVSPQDVNLQFTLASSYDLPIGKGRGINVDGVPDAIFGEWTGNVIMYLSSGIPIATPVVGAGTAYFNQRPNLDCNPAGGAPHTATNWFNPTCFSIPTSSFVPGNAPAYLANVRTMGARDFDISLYKHFSLGGERDLRFDISAYNIANRAQLGMPNTPTISTVVSNPSVAATFGQITTTVNTPRQFQFGSRFTF